MRNLKKIFAFALTGCLAFGMLAGCGKEASDPNTGAASEGIEGEQPEIQTEPTEAAVHPTDPLEMITDGYYTYAYSAEGYGNFVYYFHFYEEDPVLGAVYYAGFANNGSNFAGTYTLEETPYDYSCSKDREEVLSGTVNEGTAPYTITFYDWSGNVIEQCGYDGDVIYNNLATIAAAGSSNVYYNHDIEGEDSQFASIYEEEMGVTYLEFVGTEDELATLSLSHNRTYVDLVSTIVEGTWEISDNAEGGFDYTLIPDDEGKKGAVVSVSADTKTAAYIQDGSDEVIEMVNASQDAAAVVYEFDGTFTMADYGVDANLYLYLYEDGNAELVADVYGNVATADTGTYEVAEDGTITLTMDSAGSMTSDGQTVPFTGTTALGDLDEELILNTENGEDNSAASKEVLFSFTGGFCSFDCYTDNTFKFAFESYGIEETGTWAFDAAAYQFTITRSDGSEIVAEIGDDYSMNFEYVSVNSDQLSDQFTCDSGTWGAALVQQ